jgi:uncharacterized protein
MTIHSSSDVYAKHALLRNILMSMGSVAVAFSGGVDSTLLLKVACDELGDKVVAVTARSETTPRHEMDEALKLAREFGVRHLVIDSDELSDPEFTRNPKNKCYICKRNRFAVIIRPASEEGFSCVVDGSNLDDNSDYRPGIKALRELGIRSPLQEAGLTKREIRVLSRDLGLSTWDKPPYACLATRIPYGHPITAEKLRQVDAGEDFIRDMHISRQARVRHYGDTARIEVSPDAVSVLLESGIRAKTVGFFKELGFTFVTVDLEGYRMGSLNGEITR